MVYKNINWLSLNKNQMAKNMKLTIKEWFKNKKFNTKTNKRISKSNSPQRKMSLNEEWYIIPRELETEEIIHQNHIKYGPHLKVNPTLKEIINLHTIGTILRKISDIFISSVLPVE